MLSERTFFTDGNAARVHLLFCLGVYVDDWTVYLLCLCLIDLGPGFSATLGSGEVLEPNGIAACVAPS